MSWTIDLVNIRVSLNFLQEVTIAEGGGLLNWKHRRDDEQQHNIIGRGMQPIMWCEGHVQSSVPAPLVIIPGTRTPYSHIVQVCVCVWQAYFSSVRAVVGRSPKWPPSLLLQTGEARFLWSGSLTRHALVGKNLWQRHFTIILGHVPSPHS